MMYPVNPRSRSANTLRLRSASSADVTPLRAMARFYIAPPKRRASAVLPSPSRVGRTCDPVTFSVSPRRSREAGCIRSPG